MALKLPSPEQYGKALAEKRRRASRIPEILQAIKTATQDIGRALEAIEGVSGAVTATSEDAVRETRQAIGEAVEAVPLDMVLERLAELMANMESLTDVVTAQGERLVLAVQGQSPPTDLEPIHERMLKIEALLAMERAQVQVVEIDAPAQPSEMSLVVTDRDDAGDIAGVQVRVTRH